MPDDVPDPIRAFISEHIGSIAHLELLLLLAQHQDRAWTPAAAAKALYVGEDPMRQLMEGMASIGWLKRTNGGEFQFAPQDAAIATQAAELAQLYQERRLTVVNLIYAGPVDKLRSLADAFRFRREQ